MDFCTFLPEVHAIARTKIELQFRDALAHRLNVAEKSILQTVDANTNFGPRLDIETVQPFGERLTAGLVLADEDFSLYRFQLRSRPIHSVTFKSHLSVAPPSVFFKVKD